MSKAYEFWKTKEGEECLDRFEFAEAYKNHCVNNINDEEIINKLISVQIGSLSHNGFIKWFKNKIINK